MIKMLSSYRSARNVKMINTTDISFMPKSSSTNSLHELSTTGHNLLSPTTNQEQNNRIHNNNERRKAIIPTPN
ncbi:unnamed protein product [Rotaria magnacalcarata]|uniref:Uncharacterized protein n=2 Tax=Rotaria magnacalcarata TaxID=392030 RepID=A0A8S2N836_9BILA|nr:unnamed protein product [Rotaria magnacalcarata]